MGLMHGINDCVAGFVLGSLVHAATPSMNIGLWVLIYNALAFGGQAPLALLIDKYQIGKPMLLLASFFNALGLSLFVFFPIAAVILLGLGSALMHITGGSLCLISQPGKASVVGLFTAPGVLGLGIGGFLAFTGCNAALPLLLVTVALAVITLLLPMPIALNKLSNKVQGAQLDHHDWIMMLLLLIIAMRSAIWNTFQHIHNGDYSLLLLLAAAAMGGKIAGGYLADRVGWRNYALGALLLAAPLLGLGGRKPLLLAIGVGLLQSVTPLTLAAMHKATPPVSYTHLTLPTKRIV